MVSASLPPGFRFHPTDEELVGYYLKRKVEGLEMGLEVIPVIDFYKFDPWELPEKSFLPKRDMEWFFFCPRDKKYPNGTRTNRATRAGYWKATGKDRKIVCRTGLTSYRKTLVFYSGRAPLGDRTDWVMHEYRLCDDHSQGSPSFQGSFALCRVIKKSENAQKTRDVHGKPKAKVVGSSSNKGDLTYTRISSEPVMISEETPFEASSPNHETTKIVETSSVRTNLNSFSVSPDLILDSSKEYPQGERLSGFIFQQYEYFPNLMTQWKPCHWYEISPSSSFSNFTEEVEVCDDLSQFGCISPY